MSSCIICILKNIQLYLKKQSQTFVFANKLIKLEHVFLEIIQLSSENFFATNNGNDVNEVKHSNMQSLIKSYVRNIINILDLILINKLIQICKTRKTFSFCFECLKSDRYMWTSVTNCKCFVKEYGRKYWFNLWNIVLSVARRTFVCVYNWPSVTSCITKVTCFCAYSVVVSRIFSAGLTKNWTDYCNEETAHELRF